MSRTHSLTMYVVGEHYRMCAAGISWLVSMYNRAVGCILADEMGLGKTLQTIGSYVYLKVLAAVCSASLQVLAAVCSASLPSVGSCVQCKSQSVVQCESQSVGSCVQCESACRSKRVFAGLLAHLAETRPQNSGPYLIVVPLSVLANWINEVEQWCPTLRTVKFHGVKDERQRLKVLLTARLAAQG